MHSLFCLIIFPFLNFVLFDLIIGSYYSVFQLVFSSSATVYGWPKEVPCTEESPISATNPYGRTKVVPLAGVLTQTHHVIVMMNDNNQEMNLTKTFCLCCVSFLSRRFAGMYIVLTLNGRSYCLDTSTLLVHILVVTLVKILLEFPTISCLMSNKLQLAGDLTLLSLEPTTKQRTVQGYVCLMMSPIRQEII